MMLGFVLEETHMHAWTHTRPHARANTHGFSPWFSAEPVGVLIPFVSALAPVPTVVVLPVAESLALLASLVLGLLVGLIREMKKP